MWDTNILKIESLIDVLKFIKDVVGMVNVDIRDVFFTVSVNTAHQHYSKFGLVF